MNLIQWQKLDCIHKGVCFHNGIKCGEFICPDIHPKDNERTCKFLSSGYDFMKLLTCSVCGDSFSEFASCADEYNYCPNCGAKVVE